MKLLQKCGRRTHLKAKEAHRLGLLLIMAEHFRLTLLTSKNRIDYFNMNIDNLHILII